MFVRGWFVVWGRNLNERMFLGEVGVLIIGNFLFLLLIIIYEFIDILRNKCIFML